MRPVIEVYYPSYFQAETHVVAQLNEQLQKIGSKGESGEGSG
jgi:hypothetical protein